MTLRTTTTQADALRRVTIPPAPPLRGVASSTAAPLVAVTGGKGGVGKSTVAANLAVAIARGPSRGLAPRVLLADMDLGLASLDAILGLPRGRTSAEAIDGGADPRDLLVRGPGGVEILPAPRGVARFANLDAHTRSSFLGGIRRASVGLDAAVLDLPAGIHPDALAFSGACDLALVVTTPDPAALADAYAVVKLACEREGPSPRLGIVVNAASGPLEARQLTERFLAVVQRFLGVPVEAFGWIPRDAAVTRATASRRPVVLAEPGSAAAASFRLLAARVTAVLPALRRPDSVPLSSGAA